MNFKLQDKVYLIEANNEKLEKLKGKKGTITYYDKYKKTYCLDFGKGIKHFVKESFLSKKKPQIIIQKLVIDSEFTKKEWKCVVRDLLILHTNKKSSQKEKQNRILIIEKINTILSKFN